MKKITVMLFVLLVFSQAYAVIEPHTFTTDEQEQQFNRLLHELRCLVCQNQSLAESNAGLAGDLRIIVYEKVMEGAPDDEIVDFLVSRYGDFVLYRPPVKKETYLLWYGPLALMLVGVAVVVTIIRRKAKVVETKLNDEERQEIKDLLNKKGGNSS